MKARSKRGAETPRYLKRWAERAVSAQLQVFFFIGLVAVLAASIAYVWIQQPLRASAEMEHELARNVGRILTLDEVLTMSARMAASSRDRRYEERYLAHVDELDRLIKSTLGLVPDPEVSAAVRSTEEANLRLVEMEMRSFELDRAGLFEDAARLVDSAAYRSDKAVYASGMGRAYARLETLTSLQTASVARQATLLQIAAVASLMLVFTAWSLEQRQRRSEAADSARDLRGKVDDRTRDLEATHTKLVETARQAGMAEVAIGVLHNVGNVLNSVNVSASLIDEQLRASRAPDLVKVGALLKTNETDLGAYITTDPKGRLLPAYVMSLGDHLVSEQANLRKELDALSKGVDHIKQIVSAHQSYARTSNRAELLDPIELMEDAIFINAEALIHQEVRVERDYAEIHAIRIDKHKLLQILVNLVKNALAALEDSQTQPRSLFVAVNRQADDESKLILQVKDNGVGILPENMSHLFEHGFTTKPAGNGFGLHASILAVHALGGSLRAHSDGFGTGATFTVSVPFAAEGTEAT